MDAYLLSIVKGQKMSANVKQYTIEPYKLNYRACIPFYILLDPDLSLNEIRLYGLIEQLESSNKDVFISDRKFAEILGISHESNRIQAMKRKLIKKNYIKRELRLVTIGKRKAEMHCWNTVKGSLAENNTDTVSQEPTKVKNNTTPVPVKPTPPVPLEPTPPVPVEPTCKALSIKALELTTTTTETPVVVVVILNSEKITTLLRTAFSDNPVETPNIKTETDFLSACEYSVNHRNDGNMKDPISEMQRVRGIIKLVKNNSFDDPPGWSKQKPANKKEVDKRLRLQEEASLRKWQEEEKIREVERKRQLETPITINLVEQPSTTKSLGGVLAGLPLFLQ